MSMKFDIDQDELPIFLAETDEQIQCLDEGLIRLEQAGEDDALVNELFRAAHTLKGAAGMIGHKRMVTVTHALENALDGLRKDVFTVTTSFVDLCLEAVDGMRMLRDEVLSGEESDIEVDELAARFSASYLEKNQTTPTAAVEVETQKQTTVRSDAYNLRVSISPDSIASAARAMLVVLTLQGFGEIVGLKPTQEEIDSALPVHYLEVALVSDLSAEQLKQAVLDVGEIDAVAIDSPQKKSTGKAQHVKVRFTEDCIASAARALQVVYLLQEVGRIVSISPSQQEIETAKPVEELQVSVETDLLPDALKNEIESIADIAMVQFAGNEKQASTPPVPAAEKTPSTPPAASEPSGEIKSAIKKAPAAAPVRATADKTIRTSVERMDNMMNLVGELITDRNRLMQIKSFFELQYRGHENVEVLTETVAHLGRITDQLQKEVMDIRMSPISNVFHKFPRMVRDLSRKFNKKIDLVIAGEDTELDRTVIEEITDPLIHLIRNAVDHAIETPEERTKAGKPDTGKILLDARHEEGRIIITIEDDGKGIDVEKVKRKAVSKGFVSESEANAMTKEDAVNLVFYSGLSTASAISDISGRGVGLDIVRNNIQRLNGTIVLETTPGEGTRFQITLPLTLAIVPTLLVRVGKSIFAIPLITVSSTLRILKTEIRKINRVPVVKLRDRVLPLLRLSEVFKIESKDADDHYDHIVVVGTGNHQMGLVVDSLIGQEEVVVKSMGPLIGDVYGVSSAAILGDGKVILIVDVQDLYRISGSKKN